MKYIQITACLFLVIMCGCRQNKFIDADKITRSDFAETRALKGIVTEIKPVAIVGKILCVDTLLLTLNAQSFDAANVFSLKTNQKLKQSISVGRGPNEMLQPQSVQVCGDSIWFFDTAQGKLMGTNIQQLTSDSSMQFTAINLSINGLAQNALWTKDKRHITTDCFDAPKSRFSIYDRAGEKVMECGVLPFNTVESEDPFLAVESAISTMNTLSNGNTVVAYKRSDILEVYDERFTLKRRVWGPDYFLPSLKVVSDGTKTWMSSGGDEYDAYFSPVIVNDEIWVIYSGRKFDPDTHSYLNNTIYVFDHALNPLRILQLDIPIFTFTVDPTHKVLYAVTVIEGEDRIIKYAY